MVSIRSLVQAPVRSNQGL